MIIADSEGVGLNKLQFTITQPIWRGDTPVFASTSFTAVKQTCKHNGNKCQNMYIHMIMLDDEGDDGIGREARTQLLRLAGKLEWTMVTTKHMCIHLLAAYACA